MFKSRISKSLREELRPLTARALKSTLDTLRPYLLDSTLLELYAGQGRWGIGALTEGAKQVVFVEKNKKTTLELTKRLQHPSLPQEKFKVLSMDVEVYLQTTHDTFDIAFADPPFGHWKTEFEIWLLTHVTKILKPGSIFLVKHPKEMVLSKTPENFQLWKSSVFGESGLTYFRYGEEL